MTKENIEELKKILYSKVDQLSTLIGDNIKTVHYDLFKINKENLSSGIEKIKDLLSSDSNNELEILIMKKDLVEITKDFLEKNILDDIIKEKKRLKIARNIYLFLIFLLLVIGAIAYGNYFNKLLNNFKCEKAPIHIAQTNNINSGNNTNQTKGVLIETPIISGSNNISGTKLVSNNILSGTSQSGENISGTILSGNNFSGNINNLSGTIQTGNILSGANNNLSGTIQTGSNTLSGTKVKVNNILTGNYLFGTISNYEKIDKNKINGQIKIMKNYQNKGADIKQLTGNYTIKNNDYIMLLYTGTKYENITGGIFSGTYLIKGKLKENLLLGNILAGNKIIDKKEKIKDENKKILSGEKIEQYKKEKAQKCPYDGTIKVNVFALNFRESNTQYSKKLGILKRGTELEVLGCKKNLKSDSWWYKVKIKKTGDIGWVSTIGVGK